MIELELLKLSIKVSGKEGKIDISTNQFIHCIISETAGIEGIPTNCLTLPVCEIKFTMPETKEISDIIKDRTQPTTIEVIIYPNPENAEGKEESWTFKKTNADIEYINVDVGVNVTLYGVLHLESFTDVPQIYATDESNSSDVLNQSPFSDYLETTSKGISTSDKQVWIQPNIPNYLFISDILRHSYIEGSVLISAMNYNKVKLIDLKKAYDVAKGTKITLRTIGLKPAPGQPLSTKLWSPNKININTISGTWDYTLSDNTQSPVFQVKEGKLKGSDMQIQTGGFFSSLFSSSKDSTERSSKTRTLPLKIDTGSIHENFFEAEIQNQQMMYKLLQNIIYVDTETHIEGMLRPLDFVNLNLDTDNIQSAYTGVALIMGISRYITPKGQSARLYIVNSF